MSLTILNSLSGQMKVRQWILDKSDYYVQIILDGCREKQDSIQFERVSNSLIFLKDELYNDVTLEYKQKMRTFLKDILDPKIRYDIYRDVLELINEWIEQQYKKDSNHHSRDKQMVKGDMIATLEDIIDLSEEDKKNLDNKTKNIIMENKEELAKLTDDDLLVGFEAKIKQLDNDINKYICQFQWSVAVDIVAILGIGVGNYTQFNTDMDFWQLFFRGVLLSVSILPLLIWLTKFFNRRLHESVHLKEDYEHRSLVLKSFSAYRQRLLDIADRTDDYRQLAHFIERVNTCITENPAESLNRKKGDRLPISEISELINALQLWKKG